MARSFLLSLSLLLVVSYCWCGQHACAGAVRPAPLFGEGGGNASFVRAWCARAAEYPALCDSTLSPYAASVGDSPARLSWAALTVAHDGARNATSAMRAMAAAAARGSNGALPPVAAEAVQDCVSMLADAAGELGDAADAMARVVEAEQEEKEAGGGGNSNDAQAQARRRRRRFEVDSVRTWASAALTDGDMCVEGFKGEAAGSGGRREAVRGHVVRVERLAANALGIVNAMADDDDQTPP
ncbi:pectinesterase inhibitor 7 [Brachypodium distachyon]|uniref:Pectinesterase inhibitor domain-containing protein n=1 Tax=Brachypodium distachyon TaxID=15368 RepID=I1I5D9_BRADI|nr:pectinesterase inhibitor 7 [Brachypodium distachyon]KQJ97450.1 hypothetical protein BRADI_3g30770v3 [Brachypodium distachyon]|eukprot:XP_003571967.1 pectinesterase inhibitor 7 [Brachypodium distachyon]